MPVPPRVSFLLSMWLSKYDLAQLEGPIRRLSDNFRLGAEGRRELRQDLVLQLLKFKRKRRMRSLVQLAYCIGKRLLLNQIRDRKPAASLDRIAYSVGYWDHHRVLDMFLSVPREVDSIILIGWYLEQREMADIASQIGLSKHNTIVRKCRAVQMLRKNRERIKS